jgi:hypothetical protein
MQHIPASASVMQGRERRHANVSPRRVSRMLSMRRGCLGSLGSRFVIVPATEHYLFTSGPWRFERIEALSHTRKCPSLLESWHGGNLQPFGSTAAVLVEALLIGFEDPRTPNVSLRAAPQVENAIFFEIRGNKPRRFCSHSIILGPEPNSLMSAASFNSGGHDQMFGAHQQVRQAGGLRLQSDGARCYKPAKFYEYSTASKASGEPKRTANSSQDGQARCGSALG